MVRSENKKRTGIYGGTFNPIHKGHVNAAVKVSEKLNLDEIIFIPVNIPPHKDSGGLVSPEDRINMVNLALGGYESFRVSDMEIKRKGASYTYDTLSILDREVDGDLFFIMGTDSFLSLESWYRWQEIVKIANIVVVNRPEFEINDNFFQKNRYTKGIENRYYHNKNKDIYIIDIEGIDISSTQIRDGGFSIESTGSYVDERVRNYIKEKGLYQ